MTEKYKSRHGALTWCKQPSSTGGLAAATPAKFKATGAGTTTTIVSTTLGIATNAHHVGEIVECVKAGTSGTEVNKNCRAMVKAADVATNTLTLDHALNIATAAGDEFRLYTTPDAPVVATSIVAGGATVIATGRTEVDDRWNGDAMMGGYYLEVLNGDNISTAQHPLISDFDAASDTFTLATSFGVDVNVGDVMRCVKHLDVDGVLMLAPEQPDLPSNSLVGGYGSPPAQPGNRGGGGAIVLKRRGPGRGREGGVSEADEALSCVLETLAARTGVVVTTGSTINAVNYDAGAPDVGDVLITEEGDAFVVTADSGTVLTPSPPLRRAPANDTTLVGARSYSPADVLQAALTIYNWKGNVVCDTFYGCVPVPTLEWSRGGEMKISLAIRAADHYQYLGERGWYPRLPTSKAQRTRDMRCCLWDGTTVLELPLLGATADLGVEVKDLGNITAPNEHSGFEIVNVQGSGTMKVRLTAADRRLLRDRQGGRRFTLMLQAGAASGDPGIDGLWAYAVQLTGVPVGDDAGELVTDVAFKVVRDEAAIALGLPQLKLFIA